MPISQHLAKRFTRIARVLGCVGATILAAVPGYASDDAEMFKCLYPITVTFGVADNFSPGTPDPIPYNPALPEFVTYLTNTYGADPTHMITFDDPTPNRWMVATLSHGLRKCFCGATSLKLCFRASAHGDIPSNDTVNIYDTDFPSFTFPSVYGNYIASLVGSWNAGDTATICIDLTSQMTTGQIGDMLQFAVQDDTAVDYITMTLQ
ncbi:MAG TPA: hypothetical protein VF173_07690 [Thermoanaerobaculia bacterium]|nr:hypothetical protein [Thermoanaerobaculia bacterium]